MNWKERLLNIWPWSPKEEPEDLPGKTTSPESLPYKTTEPVNSELSSDSQAPAPYSPPATLLDGPTEPFPARARSKKELEILQIIERAAQNGVTELDLSGRRITTLPAEIGQLTNLTTLSLEGNLLSNLPSEIGQLINLRELHLGYPKGLKDNQLSDLPASICSLKNLTILDLSHNQLSTLPAEIGQLINLKKLNLSRNQLSSLPDEIGQLTNLRELNLGYQEEWGSGISYLPASICSLKNLTILDLSYNQFSTLPAEIGQLTHLTILHLESNQLSSLPPEIGRLTRLRELFLYNNKLSSLPAEIGQLSNLVTLSLYNNQISSLPTEIAQLINLTTLNLGNNQLSTLPAEIGQLINLTTLNLGNNQLSTLPAEIGQLTNLARLFLSQSICPECEAFTIPGQVFCQDCGTSLRLAGSESQGNQLSTLPPEMAQLTNLKGLDLRDNPLPIPPEILSRTNEPATILDYYFRSKHPLNEAKLVLVGEGRVGKTSLVKRLVEDQFDPDERITEGIAIKDWKVTVGEAEIKLNIWDFGGQEIMHATHQFFLTLRSLYVLVLDVQQDEESNRLAYWFKMIESFGANSPIIVVSNQIDQRRELFLNQGELVKKYPNIKAFVETSCQSGEGIAKLKAQITAQIDVLAHVRDEIPIQWLTVKSELESLRKDYVAYDEYVALCQANGIGIDQEQEQRILIQLLHDLGVVLNFPDAGLRETNVLNPSWVTGGVYQIIHAQAILQRQGIREMGQLDKGILEVRQLDQILDKKRYPREKHLFIMDMMRKFELCFDIDGHLRERFLIPDLLPEAEPALSFHVDSFNMQLQYEFLPQSVISRLMVRMNRDIFEDTYWRHGMVLVHNANRAIIKALPKRKKIIISIIGEPKSRAEFWQRINQELNEIRRHIRRLTWKPQVPIYKKPECTACGKMPTRFAARFCSQCGQKFPKYDEQTCLNCEFPNPVGPNLCLKCGVGLWPLPVAMIDYSELYDLQQKGIETHYVKGKDGLVKIHVGELLGKIRTPAKADEPERVANLKSALEPLRLRVHPQKFYELTFLLGRLYYEEVGDHSYARAALEDGHHAIEALRRLTQNERAQVDLSAESVKLYEMVVQCCVVEQQFEKAFEHTAAAKGRSFVNQLAEARIDLARTEAEKPDFALKLGQARDKRREIDELESQISQEGSNRHDLLGEQELLLRKEAELWREMEHDYPILTATLSVPRLEAADARALAHQLGATLVEYYRHAAGWCAFVVTGDRIRYVRLPQLDDNLLDSLAEWRNHVHLRSGRSRRRLKRLANLHSAAVAPLGLASQRVIIAPFRELHLLPLAAAYDAQRGRYLAERHTLSYVPSLTALHVVYQEQKRHPSSQAFKRLLSVAYPGRGESYLPNVLEEAEAIAHRLAGVATIERLHQEDATPGKVLKRLKQAPNVDVIHFGCHGKFDSRQPTESGLMLAQKPLTIEQIITQMNLKPTRLATLAACLTGKVALRDGEEHIGLLQAMMTAGVQTVVASLWAVDDAATRALFEAFYSREAMLNAPAQAMREASKLLRDTEAWAHPFYWAAFAVNGLVQPTGSSGGRWPPADLHSKMKIYAQEMTRHRSEMTNEKIIENAELLLKDLLDDCEEVWHALQPPYALSQEVAQQQVAAGQLGLAQALHLIVRDNPALHEFTAEDGTTLRIDAQQHEKRHQSPPSLENSGQVWNEVSDIFEVFNAVVQQEYESNAKKKHNKRGILKRVFDRFLPNKGDSHYK